MSNDITTIVEDLYDGCISKAEAVKRLQKADVRPDLRDYFAATVFPAIAAEYLRANGSCIGADHPYKNIPVHVYRMADAMLAERDKKS